MNHGAVYFQYDGIARDNWGGAFHSLELQKAHEKKFYANVRTVPMTFEEAKEQCDRLRIMIDSCRNQIR